MIAPNSNSGSSEQDQPYYVSQDGLLALTISTDVDGEQLIGFHGFEWNVQISVLSELTHLSHEEARRTFIDDVLEDRAIIAVLRRHGEISDVWVTDAPKMDLQYVKEGESLEFRRWSGKTVDV